MDNNKSKIIYLCKAAVLFFCVGIIFSRKSLVSCVCHCLREELFPTMCEKQDANAIVKELFPIFLFEGEPEGLNQHISYEEYVWKETEKNTENDESPFQPTDTAESFADGTMTLTDAEKQDTETVMGPTVTGGISYSFEQLSSYDFLIGNCFNIASSTIVYPEELDAKKMLGMDMTVDLSGEEYKVLIYHTHGSEAYIDSRPGVAEDTVIGVGDELTRILSEQYGIKVYHDRTAYDCMEGVLNRDRAYEYSAQGIDRILAENTEIEVIIDVHRDGVREDLHLMRVVNQKPCAQLMFVNGMSRSAMQGEVSYLENPYRETNLAFGFALHISGREKYGELFRRNYISGYRYNLHKMPKAALVEVGAQSNTVEEAKNAMEPLAEVIYDVISGGMQ
ncbi:MAG: stage II sporulation protein P [Eubacteriales bacterium]|nr:stage II sporulation protein P [Eubacteriales bacterium]